MKKKQRSVPFLILLSLTGLLAILTLIASMMGVEQFQYRYSYPIDFAAVNDPTQAPKVLLIGNSLLFYNDIDKMATQIAREVDPEWKNGVFIRLAYPGQTLEQHWDIMHRYGSDLKKLLSNERAGTWTHVVMQDQSAMMMREDRDPYKRASFETIDRFASLARALDAKPMLFAHWAYSPTFERRPEWAFNKMSARIEEGYAAAAAASKNDIGVVHVANAFARFGRADKDRLPMLYSRERKPSKAGTFLAACVLVATLTGKPVSQSTWMPSKGVDKAGAAMLRKVADEVVFSAQKK